MNHDGTNFLWYLGGIAISCAAGYIVGQLLRRWIEKRREEKGDDEKNDDDDCE